MVVEPVEFDFYSISFFCSLGFSSFESGLDCALAYSGDALFVLFVLFVLFYFYSFSFFSFSNASFFAIS